MALQALSSSIFSRIEVLQQKHAVLSNRIEKAQHLPSTTDYYLTKMKKQKLLLKQEIEYMKRAGSK